jgi:phosphoglycolate phosphatase-like HAD superfamily hydrolase
MGTVMLPEAIALDFDGVLCDGLKEYFQIALKTYAQIWPEAVPVDPSGWHITFGRLRPIVETGWEMPVVLRALQQGYAEADLLANWPAIRQQVMAGETWDSQQIGALVDHLRDQWIATDFDSWLALHGFYPGVATQLHTWIAQQRPIFIITTKESRFVQALLQLIDVALSPTVVFGKDRQQPKSQTLRQLQAQGFQHLWFVEDRWATLQVIQQQADLQQVRLFLADWGYNTVTDRQAAVNHPSIHLLSLHQLNQPLEQWCSVKPAAP